jgi:hypothetical protein
VDWEAKASIRQLSHTDPPSISGSAEVDLVRTRLIWRGRGGNMVGLVHLLFGKNDFLPDAERVKRETVKRNISGISSASVNLHN